MTPRPSEPLLAFLRDTLRRKGLTTASLAARIGRDRGELKRSLAGLDPLSVDDLVLVSQALELTPAELGLSGVSAEPPVEEPEEEPSAARPIPLRPAPLPPAEPVEPDPDPFGNFPRQILEMGFVLGVDLFAILDSTLLPESGVPPSVLGRFPDRLPIQFEARYHRHNKPVFGEDNFQCVLSFDRLYACTFPWTAFREVRFILPTESGPSAPARPTEPPKPPPPSRPTLRVVK